MHKEVVRDQNSGSADLRDEGSDAAATTQSAADADDAMLGSDTAAAARGGVDANDAAAASLGDTAADAYDAVDALLGLPLLP